MCKSTPQTLSNSGAIALVVGFVTVNALFFTAVLMIIKTKLPTEPSAHPPLPDRRQLLLHGVLIAELLLKRRCDTLGYLNPDTKQARKLFHRARANVANFDHEAEAGWDARTRDRSVRFVADVEDNERGRVFLKKYKRNDWLNTSGRRMSYQEFYGEKK